jgi:hypothetical protein
LSVFVTFGVNRLVLWTIHFGEEDSMNQLFSRFACVLITNIVNFLIPQFSLVLNTIS